MSTTATEIKRRTREQWGNDPCGAIYGDGHDIGSREFFDNVEAHRYQVYAPWMPEVMEFNGFPSKELLEVGCGMGSDLLQFARGGALVTGLDYTPKSIELTRRRFAVYDVPGRFTVGDAENLPFPDASFDVVYSNGVLHHTPDTQRAIDEVYRVLRPGGVAKVMLYHRQSLYYWLVIILRFGILRGELAKSTAEEIMSRYVEYSETGARPLVRAYTRDEVIRMFGRFGEKNTAVRQLTREELHLPALVPDGLVARLGERWGWNVIITARK
ncbi:MAG TPA: class I SAM-dependent methyltransferase [Blastocatellia bacterium]|nr:class I SAM-dependent methyltransferase [Blastocatellia bacterium]